MEAPSTQDEEVLWTGSVSHWHYAGRWCIALLFLAALIATFFRPPTLDGGPASPWILRGILLGISVIVVIWLQIDRSRRKYTVTSRRVTSEYGIISKNSREMRVDDIRSIDLATVGFSGLMGIGRLEFSSASDSEDDVVFWNTPKAHAIRDLVRSLQAKR